MFKTFHTPIWSLLWTMWHSILFGVCLLWYTSWTQTGSYFEKYQIPRKNLYKKIYKTWKIIYPKYRQIAFNIHARKADLKDNSQELTTTINKHGEELHREIDIAMAKLKYYEDKIESKHMVALNMQEHEIRCTLYKIKQSIEDLKKVRQRDKTLQPPR